MTVRTVIDRIFQQGDINFLLTNRIPRRQVTRLMGWFSKIEQPLVRDASLAVWRLFTDLDLSDARKTSFSSVHDCFTRELKEGARPADPDPALLASPCDAIVGACGAICDAELLQVKGSRYTLEQLMLDPALAAPYRNGCYVTLRLTSAMYHRFHAPHDCTVEHVTYIPGDAWNVNPSALARVDKLFCKNERVVLRTRLAASGHILTLVPVAAILVAGIRLRLGDGVVDPRHLESSSMPCRARFQKGQEMGWFEHGSTIIVLAPRGFAVCADVRTGDMIRAGQPLLRLP